MAAGRMETNMVELEISIVSMKENAQSKSIFFTGAGSSMRCYLLDVYTFSWKGNSPKKDEFFQNVMNFESGFHKTISEIFFSQ